MNKPRRAPRRRIDGVLLLDKPAGLTSNAALQKARWLLNAEKAGHTGTLDPLATGLLPLCFGEATKFAGELLDADKCYIATVQLGVITTTADADGEVLATCPVRVDRAQVEALLPRFSGRIEQVPPMYSALKRDGKPLYELARQGIEVERVPRQVTIHTLHVRAWMESRFELEVDCSKGTYVRTLAADIGAALGCGAHLAALRRTHTGGANLMAATTLAHLEALPLPERDRLLLPTDALLQDLPVAELNTTEAARMCHGQAVRWQGEAGARFRLMAPPDSFPAGFIGIGQLQADGWLQAKRLVASR